MKSLIQLKALRFWIHFATASVVFTFALAFAPAKAETLFLQKDMTARQLGLDDEDLFPFRSIILTFDRGYCSFVGNVMTKKVFAAGVLQRVVPRHLNATYREALARGKDLVASLVFSSADVIRLEQVEEMITDHNILVQYLEFIRTLHGACGD